jgi:hypothetical protein
VFVAGGPVKGGFYGEQPSLTDLDNGDLKPTTDLRDVYYELLSQTLQTDPTPSVRDGPSQPGIPLSNAQDQESSATWNDGSRPRCTR